MGDGNRSRILELAVAAIGCGGEAEIRVNHIVAEAGVIPPVLSDHFGSRDGLVIAAQIERDPRQHEADIVAIEHFVGRCTSRAGRRKTLVDIWASTSAANRETRWLRDGIELPGLVAGQYGLTSARVFIEHGSALADPDEWTGSPSTRWNGRSSVREAPERRTTARSPRPCRRRVVPHRRP